MNLSREMKAQRKATQQTAPAWLMGVPALVADNEDPDRQHRIKVTIPSIDPDIVYDEWARQMVLSCLGDGFGAAWVPPKGSEVVLFGQLGEKHHLFYASLYNEEMRVPEGYPDERSVGAKVPENLRFRAEELGRFDAKNVEINADELCRTTAQNAEEIIEQLHKTTAQTIETAATGQNKMTGNTALVEAVGEAKFKGGTVVIQSDGSIQITANGNVSISTSGNMAATAGGNMTLQGRTVAKVGPTI